jgi:hypothetical protein
VTPRVAAARLFGLRCLLFGIIVIAVFVVAWANLEVLGE